VVQERRVRCADQRVTCSGAVSTWPRKRDPSRKLQLARRIGGVSHGQIRLRRTHATRWKPPPGPIRPTLTAMCGPSHLHTDTARSDARRRRAAANTIIQEDRP